MARYAFLGVVVCAFVGCAAKGPGQVELSLEEAKQLSAKFKDVQFEAPERSIAGELSYLGPERDVPKNCKEIRAAIKLEWESWGVQPGRRDTALFLHLANKAVMEGDREKALQLYEKAENRDAVGWPIASAFAHYMSARFHAGQGNLYLARLAYWSALEIQAASIFTSLGVQEQGDAHELLARAAIAYGSGEYRNSELLYRELLSGGYFRLSSDYIRKTIIRGDLVEVLLRQGRFAEAEVHAREALRNSQRFSWIEDVSDRYETAYLLLNFAQVIFAQGRFEDSAEVARRAITQYRAACAISASINLARARLLRAQSLIALRQWKAARKLFDDIQTSLQSADAEYFQRNFKHNIDWALVLSRTGSNQRSIDLLRALVEKNTQEFGSSHYRTAEAHGILGAALVRAKKFALARAELERALPVLTQQSSERRKTPIRLVRFGEIIDAYIVVLSRLASRSAGTGDANAHIADAFRIVQLGNDAAAHHAVLATSARAAVKEPELAKLVREVQDLEYRIDGISRALALGGPQKISEKGGKKTQDLRGELSKLRPAHTQLLNAIKSRFPAYSELVDPTSVSVVEVAKYLGPDEALVSFYVGEDASYVWAVPKSGPVSFAVAPLGRAALSKRVTSLRRALDPEAEILGDIPDFDVAGAYELYASFLKPVEKGWRGAKHLIVVAHGPLGQLPLSVLPTKRVSLPKESAPLFSKYRSVPWLARSHAVSYAPSVSSFLTLRRLPGGDVKRLAFAGFGDPVFGGVQAQTPPAQVASRGRLSVRGLRLSRRSAPATRRVNSADLAALPRLPDTADEVKSIAVALNADPTRDVFVGSRANEDLVKSTDLSNRRVLAFATHGLVPGDLNGLTQPALALSSPASSGGKEDGLLTMGEILGLRLDADWVILSACNTASADGAGAEAVSGLGRAFFYAGARALLVSHWPVETTSARALTTSIFALQAKNATLSRASALQRSMLSLIDGPGRVDEATGKTLYSYAHPLFWAPFTLIGEGQQKQPGS